MPNPLTLTAARDGFVKVSRNATYVQRITLRQNGEIVLQTSPTPNGVTTNAIDAGSYEVTHESQAPGQTAWVKGRGQRVSAERANFDDNPTGGDNDFNDAIVWIEYP